MWKRGEIAPKEQFLLFSTLFYIYFFNFRSQRGVPIWGFFGPLPNLFIFGRWIAHHKCFIMVYLFSRTIIRFFELQAFKSGWGNLACHYSLFLKLILVIICVLFYQFFSLCRQRDVWNVSFNWGAKWTIGVGSYKIYMTGYATVLGHGINGIKITWFWSIGKVIQ